MRPHKFVLASAHARTRTRTVSSTNYFFLYYLFCQPTNESHLFGNSIKQSKSTRSVGFPHCLPVPRTETQPARQRHTGTACRAQRLGDEGGCSHCYAAVIDRSRSCIHPHFVRKPTNATHDVDRPAGVHNADDPLVSAFGETVTHPPTSLFTAPIFRNVTRTGSTRTLT